MTSRRFFRLAGATWAAMNFIACGSGGNGITEDAMRDSDVSDSVFAITYQSAPNSGYIDSVTTPDGDVLSFGYDGPLLTSETWSGPNPDSVSGTIGYTYDENFWVTDLDIAGQTVVYDRDNDGLLTGAGALSLHRNAQHGGLDSTSVGVVATSWTLDTFAIPASYDASVSGASVYQTNFVTDEIGRITEKSETLKCSHFTPLI